MHIASPRSPLNCQALSVHLPVASDYQASRTSSRYQILPMSNSPVHPSASQYHHKSGTPRYVPTSPTLLSPNYEKRSSTNQQSRSRALSGTHLLPDSSAYISGPLRSPLPLSTETTPYDEKPYDDLILNSQQSPHTLNLNMGSPGVARRAKAHVPSACVNCKRKHLACETRRPCNRCLQAGKEVRSSHAMKPMMFANSIKATCVDVQHKKRGRPRLRDEDNSRGTGYGGEYAHPQLYPAQSDAIGMEDPSQRSQYRPVSYRELRSQPNSPYDGIQDVRPALGRGILPGFSTVGSSRDISNTDPGGAMIRRLPEVNPTALLTLDFIVSQSNFAFIDALALPTQVGGKALKDLVIPSEKEKIKQLQNRLQTEMHNSMQTPYLRPLGNEYPTGTSPEEQDLFESTMGFQPRNEYWTFRLPNGQSRGFPISISLAKTNAYFVVLTLVSSANPPIALTTSASHGSWTPSPPTSSHGMQFPYTQRLVERPRRNDLTTGAPTTNPYQPYAPKSVPENLADSPFDQDLSQYRPRSSSQTHDSRTPPSAGSVGTTRSSLHGSDVPQDNLRHLQLPPIRASAGGKESSGSSRGALQEIARSESRRSSPATKASPQSGKRKKRRRVDIEEMLR